jgi:hypothetical protein
MSLAGRYNISGFVLTYKILIMILLVNIHVLVFLVGAPEGRGVNPPRRENVKSCM